MSRILGDIEGLKPERVQFHLTTVLDAEQELNAIERVLQKFDFDRIARFLELVIRFFRSLGWLPTPEPEPEPTPGPATAAA